VPSVEKTYVPLKLLFVKPPVGGGVALLELLPQATRNASDTAARIGSATRLQNDIDNPLDEEFLTVEFEDLRLRLARESSHEINPNLEN
jgi:hypothetical protein